MLGLERTTGAAASLLLNLEGVFTAPLAWFVFHENFDRRIAIGFSAHRRRRHAVVVEGEPAGGLPLGNLAIAAACFGWAIDNNLTQRVSASDPVQIAGIKGFGRWRRQPVACNDDRLAAVVHHGNAGRTDSGAVRLRHQPDTVCLEPATSGHRKNRRLLRSPFLWRSHGDAHPAEKPVQRSGSPQS